MALKPVPRFSCVNRASEPRRSQMSGSCAWTQFRSPERDLDASSSKSFRLLSNAEIRDPSVTWDDSHPVTRRETRSVETAAFTLPQLRLQELIYRRRVRLPLAQLHHLPHQVADHAGLPRLVLLHLLRTRGDHFVHDLFQRARVADLAQPFA